MIRREKEGVVWGEFGLLAEVPGLVHGVFSRHGGVSVGPFSSLNFSFSVGDEEERVAENRQKAMDALGLPKAIVPKLCHGDCVLEVREEKAPSSYCDGLMTDCKKLPLLMTHADCQATIFYDTATGAIANVHCGWKGNVQNIYGKTVEKMQARYGSRPEELLVCISPSLGPQHAQFLNYEKEFPPSFYPYQVKPFYFDLWALSEVQLLEAGVLPHHIEIARECTVEGVQDFFSYRKEGVCGRSATVVCKK